MALTIVATAKATNANSYVTLAEASTYFEGRVVITNWTAATDDAKNRALKTATDRLEQERYAGARTTQAQRLQWPRTGVTDPDGWQYDQDEYPRRVQEAQYELALALLDGTFALAPDDLEKFKRVKVGSVEAEMRTDYEGSQLPDHVLDLLGGLMVGGANDLSFAITRS